MKLSRLLIAAAFCAGSFMNVSASADIWADVTPEDWSYQAIQTLIRHGAITDTKGLSLEGQTYTRYELTPLVAEVVERREQMNESDKNIAIRLYSEFRDELMAYNREQEIRAKGHQDDVDVEHKALTKEDLDKKVDDLEVENRHVAVGGDVRFRTSNRDKSDYRARVGFVISTNGVAAPDMLYDKVGKMEIAKADKEAKESRKRLEKMVAEQQKKEAEEKAKADKKAAKEQAKADKQAAKEQTKADKGSDAQAGAAPNGSDAQAGAAPNSSEAQAGTATNGSEVQANVAPTGGETQSN